MSTEVVRELFRNLENALHDRLKVIEDILTSAKQPAGEAFHAQAKLNDLERYVNSVEEYAMGEVRTLAYNNDMLEKRILLLESTLKNMVETFQTVNLTIGSLQKRMDDGRPVEAAEADAEVDEAQEAALNADADVVATEEKAKATLIKAVEKLVEEQEEEVEEEEFEEEEEVEEEEVEEEEEDQELEAFEYKKKTYCRDANNKVYSLDDEGNADVSDVLGIWNPTTKKIDPVPQEEEESTLEAFEYKNRSYCRDEENHVYNVDDDGCADISEVVGIWNSKTNKIDRVPKA